MAKETKEFQTEIKQLLSLMVNSLYSHREIFLRELISNSSDALDKLRFAETKDPSIAVEDKHIRLTSDKEKKTLSISDNGIGMSKEEVIEYLGKIAYSGTKQFLNKMSEIKEKPELIGQFGVGFYSAFMVADKVSVLTQKAGQSAAHQWESTGDGTYTVEPTSRPEGNGTTITLHLKELSPEEGDQQDFSDEWTLKSIVKKYSDFVEYPIRMMVSRQKEVLDKDGKPIKDKFETVVEDEKINSQKALWLRPVKEIKDEEYKEFYKHVTNDWNEPLDRIHYKAEGTQEFTSLMYIPGSLPFDYNQREMKYGLNLYVNRIFITANCEELLPVYLRFVKGLVDSNDLPLNVSRELIQQDRQITLIQKALVSKILRHFSSKLTKSREEYEKMWGLFGATIKEGIPSDFSNKDKLLDLLLFKSCRENKLVTLKEYISKMPADQKEIYYMTGESEHQIKTSPYLEKLNKKKYDVLLLTDTVDEWVMNSINEYDSKKLSSITKEGLDLDTEEEKESKKKELENKQEKLKDLCVKIQESLKDHIKEVKVTDRLVDSPVCLVSETNGPSAHMERIMEKIGQGSQQKTKRTLELNPDHPVFERMLSVEEDKTQLWSQILYNQALLTEGSPIEDPALFSKQISEVMMESK